MHNVLFCRTPRMQQRTEQTVKKIALGDCAAREGNLLEAKKIFSSLLKVAPSDVEVCVKLSVIEKRLGNTKQAEFLAKKAVLFQPKLGFGHHALGLALHSQGRREEAKAAYEEAVRLQPEFADTHYLLGMIANELGDPTAAQACYERALALQPSHVDALACLGAAHLAQGDLHSALSILEKAVSLQPSHRVALANLSTAQFLNHQPEKALATLRHALVIAPDSVEVIASLAAQLEKSGTLNEAADLVARGLALAPNSPHLRLTEAQIDRHNGQLEAAAKRLELLCGESLPLDLAAEAEITLGQIFDQLKLPARAFPMLVSGNAKKARLSGHPKTNGNTYLDAVETLSKLATPALGKSIARAQSLVTDDCDTPVFLIGFPRSGTTLLEQILDSHPKLQALDEKPTVPAMVSAFMANGNSHADRLPTLSTLEIAELRQRYFLEADNYVTRSADYHLLDKLPLNTASVPLILRVFPNAKFILAIRHPCDVCLSCFMQNFGANDAMANFFSLDDTVRLYVAVMSAWVRFTELLPLKFHRVRYEDLIQDVEGQSRQLLDFLGLEWNDAVLDHVDHAKQRGVIHTPSYHQVVQPIYQHAAYRWKRYATELGPFIEQLQPFISCFGYEQRSSP